MRDINFKKNYGWVCPRCNKVHSPNTTGCDCPSVTVTNASTTTTTDNQEELLCYNDVYKSPPDNVKFMELMKKTVGVLTREEQGFLVAHFKF